MFDNICSVSLKRTFWNFLMNFIEMTYRRLAGKDWEFCFAKFGVAFVRFMRKESVTKI